ncbi:GspE/PulE family protein [Singulisphaera acidiphila]|uniref:Type II secretory pathway, ATPase PulE/Tfp pilus assembly pathway, ATPase PilB n=1 Tax=Singulisphaera acidiphila (strain ATCC BAA-1392 / DSM 18658 / VKM B-2454 / MOB10) TaxID=886293 RepID=L0DNV7_SINAD|nr:GspE/PulE family protein [Singulisphaera acidiphila]AGA30538.1 type II secretory pathway, ATPase PulE/Tfp pilus assembly pathway, ATPase PilB [Singulisphaera acidiphila DSM 18658]
MAKQGRDWTDILVKRGVIGPDQMREAQSMNHVPVEEALVKLGYAGVDEIMKAKAEQHGMAFVELREIEIPPSVIELVPESLARENIVMPLSQESGAIKVIMHDPNAFETIDKLRFVLNREIEVALAPKEAIVEAINRYYGGSSTETESVDSMLQEFTDTAIDFSEDVGSSGKSGSGAIGLEEGDAPVIRLVHLIIQEAVNMRASDIHIEPFADRVRIRYRIDGVCMERDSPPRRLLGSIVSRIKIMGSMDIAEKRRPQDGRIKMHAAGKDIDLRVSVLPTSHGQSVVMRILDRENIKVGLRDLGFGEEDWKRFASMIKRPNGILLVTGPTGSGKTTTLYAALNELNRPDVKIITAEDPVEYYLPGVNQCEVRAKIGMTFARIIRAMLRQNPNILLVGEIRDEETANTAIQASLTGHLVFSTLHTNDAPSAVTRLIDIGVQPFLVASSVMAIMAQRLVRKVCPKCRVRYEPPAHVLQGIGLKPEIAKKANFMKGKGCTHCNKSGYRGRMGIYELMTMTSQIRDMTFKGDSTQNLRRMARKQGMRTLFEDGMVKALKGLTTIDEILRITQHDSAAAPTK